MQRVAKGWETELRVAYDDVISAERLAPLIAEFYEQGSGTRLRFGAEVLGGCWDALLSGRADLAVGAPSDPPLEAGYTVRPMGEIEWVFAVAPTHPLASLGRPVSASDILGTRVVIVADSSRNLPPRSSGLAPGPDSLIVSTLQAKLACQIAGLGVGFLPAHLAARGARRWPPGQARGRGAQAQDPRAFRLASARRGQGVEVVGGKAGRRESAGAAAGRRDSSAPPLRGTSELDAARSSMSRHITQSPRKLYAG